MVLPIVAGPIGDGAVAVDGGRVLAVGTLAEVAAGHPGARTRRWPGVLTPGLVNAHAHLQYTDFADLAGSGLAFTPWIARLTERRRGFTPARWAESTRRGVHGLLRTGTTAVADVASDAAALGPPARAGLAGVSYVEAVGADTAAWERLVRARVLAALEGAPAGRAVGLSPHALYTLGTGVLRELLALARERGLRLHTHLAETAEEVEYVLAGGGPFAAANARFGFAMELMRRPGAASPARHLDALGGLGPGVHVAHGVHVGAADRALLRERGTAVALCVRSNALLRAGDAPVADYLAEGSPVGIGTDSLASSPSLDLLEEARAVRDLARHQGYRAGDLDRRVVEAATAGGAAAMGLAGAGTLAPGARADLAVFDVAVDGDPYAALVDHGGGRCVATVLDGRLVHRRGGC